MTDVGVGIRVLGRKDAARLPALLVSVGRSTGEVEDPFLPSGYLVPKYTFDISVAARSAEGANEEQVEVDSDDIVVLELTDGGTLITSAARLRESLELTHPELLDSNGAIRLERLQAASSGSRRDIVDVAGGWIKKIYTLAAGGVKDAIVREALEQVETKAELGVSWAGTKALMWAIEKRLDGEPGLYHWTGAGRKQNDLCPVDIANTILVDPKSQRMLVFVHGTASNTHGSFGDLCEGEPGLWAALKRAYQGGVYAFEHRTLSESPIENAIQLALHLPIGAHVSLVSHSRGGLVADLLCLKDFDTLIEHYAYTLEGTGDANPNEAKRVKQELAAAYAEQRTQLHKLSEVLRTRGIVVERYVRAASPANGTKLAGANLDLFLSGLLTLIGQVPYLFGSSIYAAFKRVVIEIAKNRTNPHLVPGIEAMLPDSPMAVLLRDAPVRDGVTMAVIAGDIEGGNPFQRLGLLLTDNLFFSKEDNDLVVNTRAMLAGVARKVKARVMFDRGANVSHFRYFTNFETRTALRDWLTAQEPSKVSAFGALPADSTEYKAALEAATRGTEADTERPVVVVLPGVMGSHLRRGEKDRVWFDPLDLATGGLMKIAWPEACEADDLFAWFYGNACKYLSATHRVIAFAYDWRQPLDVLADRLATLLEKLLEAPTRPIRLLAHSMGGLVVRACIHRHRAVMDRVMQRAGARFVMLGTPNQGAYSMVENLLGKGDTVRALARLDLTNPLQTLLNVIAGFPGALQLLPKPGFKDDFQGEPSGGETLEFQSSDLWLTLKKHSKDFWFGDGVAGTPSQAMLDAAAVLWKLDGLGRPALPSQYRDQCVYVHGLARNTPCGVRDESSRNGRIKMVGTSRGDGTVTWASGRIDGIGSYYYAPVPHGDLLSTEAHFLAFLELLTTGATRRLPQQPPALRSVEETLPLVYDAGPPSLEDLDTIQRGLMGGSLDQQVPPRPKQQLDVCVRAMDLRFIAQPILVGHYEKDPLAGPEALIDRELLGGELSVRHNLGLYAGQRGTAVVVLRIPNEFERQRHSLRGAVVTGLGTYDGALSVSELTEAVRTGALRYLMQVVDLFGNGDWDVTLASLLLGYNSSANLSVAASVEAVVRGVLEANVKFRETTRRNVRISKLDIVELYLDTAITAVYALGSLSTKLTTQAERLGVNLVCHDELVEGEGVRQRLFESSDAKYWPRLIVTDANRSEDRCAPSPTSNPRSEAPELENAATQQDPAQRDARAPVAEALRFLFVGQRARAEAVRQQRQPELIERIVRDQIRSGVWQEDLGRMLFQLMIPPEFKDAARQLERLVLVLDSYTANLPWELMLGDDPTREGEHQPLALRAAVVRQLTSYDFRQQVRHGAERQALVIGNPSLKGTIEAFPSVQAKLKNGIVPLPEAEAEAEAVVGVLRAFGYDVKPVIGEDQTATNILSALYQKPWRILHVSAHGVFGLRHRDGKLRSGVLLSDGLLITAAEIRSMELVPELVVLSCCHLGTLDIGHDGDKFAASVARELIDIGVRCVLVAGWAVSDSSARLFGETFYEQLLLHRQPFGDAVFLARKAVWDAQPGDITWGAFQAYGDPGWLAEPRTSGRGGQSNADHFVSIRELVDELAQLRVTLSRNHEYQTEAEIQAQIDQVSSLLKERCPSAWQELPSLQSALGATFRDLAQFEQARSALLAAVQTEDDRGIVPIRDIEQLASVETRWGEKLAENELLARSRQKDRANLCDCTEPLAGEELIDLALERLTKLDELLSANASIQLANADPGGVGTATTSSVNSERAALRGSAWKRKAGLYARRMLMCGDDAPGIVEHGKRLSGALVNSVNAYRAAEGVVGSSNFSPYSALNRLALDALTPWNSEESRTAAIALAIQCSAHIDLAFSKRPSPWYALMAPESLLVKELLTENLGLAVEGGAALERLKRAYSEATANMTFKPAEIESAAAQLELLSRFYDALSLTRHDANLVRTADRLLTLCEQLQPGRPQRRDRPVKRGPSSNTANPTDS